MALVSEDGLMEWYEVHSVPELLHPWVKQNVVPVLGKEPIGQEAFHKSLVGWLSQYHEPTIVADWYADLVHFFSSFAGRDHSESIDYPCKARLVSNLTGYAPVTPHNALSDARAIRIAFTRAGLGA